MNEIYVNKKEFLAAIATIKKLTSSKKLVVGLSVSNSQLVIEANQLSLVMGMRL